MGPVEVYVLPTLVWSPCKIGWFLQIKNSSKHHQSLLCWRSSLHQRSSSKEAGTRFCSFSQDKISNCRHARKAVVCVTELIAAFVAIRRLWTFLADVHGLLDQPGKRSGSLSITVTLDQSMGDSPGLCGRLDRILLISGKLAVRWLLVNGRWVKFCLCFSKSNTKCPSCFPYVSVDEFLIWNDH